MKTKKTGLRPTELEADPAEAETSANLYGAPSGSMQPDQDYRLLESSYRNSPEYAAMVEALSPTAQFDNSLRFF